MTRRHERSSARRRAVEILYSSEIHGMKPSRLLEEGRCLLEEGTVPDYALTLVDGVEEQGNVIDERLASTSENWSLARMPIIDRSILRLATYEMLFIDAVPVSVSINEAVELAKEFGGEDESPRFVNGVLGRIAKQIDDEASAGSADEVSRASGDEITDTTETSAGDGPDEDLGARNPSEGEQTDGK